MNSHSPSRITNRVVAAVPALVLLAAVLLPAPKPANAIPAFARKYGLPCSACHITWPELNNFGQVFRDNGYQMMNERDSPITRDPSYFPITVRITPQWHRESANGQSVNTSDGEGPDHIGTISTTGFDLSGMDLWFGGTLYKNISFIVLPSSDPTATFHFESAYVRFDNLLHTPWLNVKVGKFELDLPVSEKRLWTLSGDGGFYYIYHFTSFGNSNPFGGIGDNQLGVELMGHNANSYTRYAFAAVSSLDGGVNQSYGETVNFGNITSTFPPGGRTFDYYGHFEQGFNTFGNGFMKVGAYGYFGYAPTYFQTSGGADAYGRGNKPFYRAGTEWKWYFNKWLVKTVYMHAYDNAFLANGIAANTGPIAPDSGIHAAKWNGGFVEGQYLISPQWALIARWETIHMEQQANAGIVNSFSGNIGNLNAFTFASRWNPFMFSRAGLALQQEYSFVKSNGVTNQGGAFGANCATVATCTITSSSLFFGFDFDF